MSPFKYFIEMQSQSAYFFVIITIIKFFEIIYINQSMRTCTDVKDTSLEASEIDEKSLIIM